jgi:hypothetical protein
MSTAGARVAAAAWHRLLEWINPWFVACRDEGFGLGAFDGFSMSDVLPEDWFAYLFHFLLVGGMLWGVRRNALLQFGRLIGRLEPQYARYERPAIPLSLQKLPMDRTEFLIVDDEQRASPTGPASGTKNE